ncbi:MAG: hypothetical protein ACTS5A_01500 [Candidatus Hodgkinia cicadicola]
MQTLVESGLTFEWLPRLRKCFVLLWPSAPEVKRKLRRRLGLRLLNARSCITNDGRLSLWVHGRYLSLMMVPCTDK